MEVDGSKTFLQMFCTCFILHVTISKTFAKAKIWQQPRDR